MPAPRRIARLEKLILEVAAETIQRRLRDPRLGFVTLTHVKLSPDLHEATVYWSALGTPKERLATARALAKATGIVQSTVGKAIQTRTTPRLTFRFDETIEKAARLEEIFERLKRERRESEPTTGADLDDAAEADRE